jgi:hypothetical protein
LRLPDAGWRRELALALLLAAAAALFRLPRYSYPPEEVFDEVYHAKTALEYLHGQSPTEWVHPPTAKLLIALPVYLLGYDAFGWRLAPVLAGIALAPVFFLLARQVLASERAALLASVLLLCDGVYLVQSRIAMTTSSQCCSSSGPRCASCGPWAGSGFRPGRWRGRGCSWDSRCRRAGPASGRRGFWGSSCWWRAGDACCAGAS